MSDQHATVTDDSSDTFLPDTAGQPGPEATYEPGKTEAEACGTVPGCDGHGGCGGHGGGGCGGHAPAHTPTLDARLIDPVIRQSAIFGVLVGLPPAAAVTIVTQENPAPIAELLHERLPGEYQVSTEPSDDDSFRVTFSRA